MRTPFLHVIGQVVVVVAVGTGIYFASSPPVATTGSANEWINTTAGTSPSRCSPACAYNSTHAYGSIQAAEAASSGGDSALLKCGTYTGVQAITSVKSGANVTYASESGKCAVLQSSPAGSVVLSLSTNVSNMTFDHLTINGDIRIVPQFTGNTPNDNIHITNNDVNVGQVTQHQDILYGQGTGLLIDHNTVGPSIPDQVATCTPACDSPEGIRISKGGASTTVNGTQTISSGGTLVVLSGSVMEGSGTFNYQGSLFTYTSKSGNSLLGVTPGGTFTAGLAVYNPPDCLNQACNVTITNNLVQYVSRDCGLWPSSGFGACPGVTCTNANGCHEDGIHIWGIDNTGCSSCGINYNRVYGVECQGIFLENSANSLQKNVNIIGNAVSVVAGGCSNKGIYLSASGSLIAGQGFAGTWNIGFNSGASAIIGPNGCGSCQAGTAINFVGNNMQQFFTNASGNSAGCGSGSFGTATPTFGYNVWRSGTACGANDTVATPAFVNDVAPPAVGIDDHLGAVGTADNFVLSSACALLTTGCPSVDIDGVTRPVGANYDAGMDER